MNIAFDLCHPAHFFLFKNLIAYLKKNGNNVFIHIRDKDLLSVLLEHQGWTFSTSPKVQSSLLKAYLTHVKSYYQFTKNKSIEVHLGSSVASGIVSRLNGGCSYCFGEDNVSIMPIWKILNFPTHHMVKPSLLSFEKGKKDIYHNSYHELAYLHPDNFTPHKSVLQKYNLKEQQYIIVRFSALNAFHDRTAKGISQELWGKIKQHLDKFKLIISLENNGATISDHQLQINDIDPWDMHHLLAFAKMLISDSQTMTIESAVLGVPALRINTFIGKSTMLEKIENEYELSFGFLPNQEDEIFNCIQKLLTNFKLKKEWQQKRSKLLSEKINLNKWMIDLIQKLDSSPER